MSRTRASAARAAAASQGCRRQFLPMACGHAAAWRSPVGHRRAAAVPRRRPAPTAHAEGPRGPGRATRPPPLPRPAAPPAQPGEPLQPALSTAPPSAPPGPQEPPQAAFSAGPRAAPSGLPAARSRGPRALGSSPLPHLPQPPQRLALAAVAAGQPYPPGQAAAHPLGPGLRHSRLRSRRRRGTAEVGRSRPPLRASPHGTELPPRADRPQTRSGRSTPPWSTAAPGCRRGKCCTSRAGPAPSLPRPRSTGAR
mmetsp:Transcript_46499/g.144097  ORF Transcript_46499/g.144097 Transcript_46499/m.144097 type:complete len:253 (+) Transcript_46499:265-1023(+)